MDESILNSTTVFYKLYQGRKQSNTKIFTIMKCDRKILGCSDLDTFTRFLQIPYDNRSSLILLHGFEEDQLFQDPPFQEGLRNSLRGRYFLPYLRSL